MKIELLHHNGQLAKRFLQHCRSPDEICIAAAWATGNCAVASALWHARTRIRALVIGLDFYQTDPAFLRRFRPWLRIGSAGATTFHPKVYLFRRASTYACILGSSNLTGGGFGGNVEANLLVTGTTSDSFFADVEQYVLGLHDVARRLREEELRDYEQAWGHRRAERDRADEYQPSQRVAVALKVERSAQSEGHGLPEHLDIPWVRLARLVLAQEDDGSRDIWVREVPESHGYLGTLRAVGEVFHRKHRLSTMTYEDRRQVAGLARGFLFMGSMKGARTFQHLVNDEPARLDRALDQIPMKGPVDEECFSRFVRKLPKQGIQVATASRLLAMKRPDLFLCVNAENRAQLARYFGLSAVSLTRFPGYWDLVSLIWRCRWFTSRRPATKLGSALWDGRVAVLDALFYQRAT